jgi:hypothetical protein
LFHLIKSANFGGAKQLIKKDFGKVVFTKVAHLDVLLDDMQRVGKV